MSRSFFAPESTKDVRVDVPHSPTGRGSPTGAEEQSVPFLSRSDRDEPSDGSLQPGERSRHDARLGSKARANEAAALGGGLVGVQALAPILSYCAASITMTVVNKYVLSAKFSLNMLVLLIQCLVGVILVLVLKRLKVLQIREWNTRDAKMWAPISFLLVMVIWTGSKALQKLAIPVYTIFKNLTIILIAYGEVLWFGGRVTPLTLVSFMLMVLSSIIAAWSDISRALDFNNMQVPHIPDSTLGGGYDPLKEVNANYEKQKAATGALQDSVFDTGSALSLLNSGYAFMALNCFFSAAYVLAMRKRIKLTGFKDWDTMYFNNLLSIPVLIVMSLLVEDWSAKNFEANFPIEQRSRLTFAIIFSGACAVFISYTTAWCVRTTSSTTYSMVGALNKLPLALSGMVFFHDPVTTGSTSSIGTGFLAGLVYAYAKNKQAEASKLAATTPVTGLNTGALGTAHSTADGKVIIPLHSMNGDSAGSSGPNGKDLRRD